MPISLDYFQCMTSSGLFVQPNNHDYKTGREIESRFAERQAEFRQN